ncbi:hypothetical protein B0A50_04311 [Salinomyces thailandicus]|uniref:Heterokaryon incompatibility domain-containing protein n=1 Tax=Salinomyces thailandicus TaxID=706561 RepID=A0A4U0TYK7_9PEZI|nr:hypothetical protein B0A50_04311 [Salinomyces thailandica]
MYARANLHACLKLLQRHRLSDDFWIDAICINQGDLEEKGIQVQKMSEIYSQAQVVAICLPASDEEAAVFNEALQIFRDAYRPEIGGPDWHDPRKTYNAVQWLATNPYFRRMWIVQENALASERVLLCGSQQTPFFYVERMVGESEMFVPAGRDQQDFGAPAPKLFNVLLQYEQQQCFDSRDKVYALLGLPQMQKQKIQDVCHADYYRTAQQLLFRILEWFESSSKLTGPADPEVHRSGWTMFETASSGSGVGGPDLQIGDMIYTVPVAATQNNIPILVSLVFRTHSNGQLRPVSYAMDHLGFKASDRRAPSRALVARMPLSRRKEDRGQDIRLHLDPKTALEVTGGKEWRTLGYGWRTLKRLGNVYTSIA